MINRNSFNIHSQTSFVDFLNNNFSNDILVVPNLPTITRQLTYKSQISILISNLFKLKPKKIFILIINNLIFLPKFFKKDFATGIKILCEIEILYSNKKHYLLHNQITDTSIALKNESILNNFFYLSKKYKFTPGLITNNLEALIIFLSLFKNVPENIKIYAPFKHKSFKEFNGLINFLNRSKIEFIDISYE